MKATNNDGEETIERPPRYKGKHDKPKPWDNDSIDHWKVEKFDSAWNEKGMLEVSSFSTLFPKYREKYLQEVWPIVRGALKEHGISCELNLWPNESRTVHIGGFQRYSTCTSTSVPLPRLTAMTQGSRNLRCISTQTLAKVEGSMTVSTTLKTKDPFIIVKARDLIKLLSRSVPAPQWGVVVVVWIDLKEEAVGCCLAVTVDGDSGEGTHQTQNSKE
ncbi:hypothetical protein GIB67_006265 [Kingdonia uniflora]|uniref:KRR-R motif-containing protein 1 n=1 Tax=Kingdonia uniflora TaxID=39325 RepID=A0A7J7P5L2_9MAGN|nr:hypothetical protein GIB67_006265 [Kingdonia uniflora]